MKAGVIDPAKVVRSALQNAASIASLLLTTEAVISQAPDDHKTAAAAQRRRHGRRDVLDGMGPLRELLATDHRQALEFFFQRLKDVSGPGVDQQELLYNASVLAHYAQVSTHATVDLSTPASLSAIFDHFVADSTLLADSLMMETAGAQCLVLAGFFEDQMRRRHNIRWYAELGAGFFSRAATREASPQQGPAAGRDREALRGLAPASGAAQPRSCATSLFCSLRPSVRRKSDRARPRADDPSRR